MKDAHHLDYLSIAEPVEQNVPRALDLAGWRSAAAVDEVKATQTGHDLVARTAADPIGLGSDSVQGYQDQALVAPPGRETELRTSTISARASWLFKRLFGQYLLVLAVAGAECNTAIELTLEPHAAELLLTGLGQSGQLAVVAHIAALGEVLAAGCTHQLQGLGQARFVDVGERQAPALGVPSTGRFYDQNPNLRW